jgi:hypothetical protein
LDERDVTRAWQGLFNGKEVTPDALLKAEELLDGLSGESPLHIRFAKELAELKKMPARGAAVRAKAKRK